MERDRAVDWARGMAALAMIEGHALHGWASAAAKQTEAYAWTRVVATSPLPAFMLLAGMAVRLRLGAAVARAEDPAVVRGAIARRGLTVVLWGYLASALYAAIDGHQGARTFLRADVLHVIGLSIACLPLLCVPGGKPLELGAVARRVLWVTLAVVLLAPVYYGLAPAPPLPLGYLLAPLVRVQDVTIFPLLPMLAWTTLGYLAGHLIALARERWSRDAVYAGVALVGLASAFACEQATRAMLAGGGVLSDVHPAGIPNMLGYAARGLVLIGVGPLLVARMPGRAQDAMTRLGRASLIAYVFHIPFCYGLPARPIKAALSMPQTVPYVLLLWVLSYGVVVLWGSWSARSTPRPAAAR
jgi:hypothetical protein